MPSPSNFCVALGCIAVLLTCFVLSADNYAKANENEGESLSKIGQGAGAGHNMNIYYWYVRIQIMNPFKSVQSNIHPARSFSLRFLQKFLCRYSRKGQVHNICI